MISAACQSYYETFLAAGADIASSPLRLLTHCLDPPLLVEYVLSSGEDMDPQAFRDSTISGEYAGPSSGGKSPLTILESI